MRHDLVLSQSIDIHAEPSKVWHVLTTPEIIKEYLFGTETITDWKVDSEIIFQGEYEGFKYKDKGIILENELNKLITYSYWSSFFGLEDKPEHYNIVSYLLEDIGNNQTKFTWTQKGFVSEDAYNNSINGTPAFLAQIKSIVER